MLGYEEIAKLLGVSVEAVRMRKYRGTLPTPDIDRSPLWKPETIEEWMDNGQVRASDERTDKQPGS